MSQTANLKLLFIGAHNIFSELLSSEVVKNGITVTKLRFSQFTPYTLSTGEQYDYVVFDFFSYKEGIQEFLQNQTLFSGITNAKSSESKILLLLPHAVSLSQQSFIEQHLAALSSQMPALGILFVSDIVSESGIEGVFQVNTSPIVLPSSQSFISCIAMHDAIDGVLRNIFSLRAYGHTQVLYGLVTTSFGISGTLSHHHFSSTFDTSVTKVLLTAQETQIRPISLENVIDYFPEQRLVFMATQPVEEPAAPPPPLVPQFVDVAHDDPVEKPDLPIHPVVQTPLPEPISVPKKKKAALFKHRLLMKHLPRIRISFRSKKTVLWTALFLLLFVLPYLFSFVSVSLSSFALRQSLTGNSVPLLGPISYLVSQSSLGLSTYAVSLRGASFFYNESLSLSRISSRMSSIAVQKNTITKQVPAFLQYTFLESDSRESPSFTDMVFAYETMYADLGFAESEIQGLSWSRPFVSSLISFETLSSSSLKALNGKALAADALRFFDSERPKTIALVFQDTKILRPTGGKISSIVFLTFENGTIATSEVVDLDSSVRNRGGVVTPPYALSAFAGIQNWEVEDANWDYSYPESAEKVAWFLNIEFDRTVDGIITLSSNGVSELLHHDGREVSLEEEMVAQTIQSLTDSIHNFESSDQELLLGLLDRKEMLLYANDEGFNRSLSAAAWNGSFYPDSCTPNCYADRVSVNESNVGEENDKLDREVKMTVSLENGKVKHTLKYYVKNNADKTYETYVRVVAPKEATFAPVYKVTTLEKREVESHVYGIRDDKEIGAYIEIANEETIALEFSWETPGSISFQENGSYELFVQKQPGVRAYPWSLDGNIENQAPLTLSSPFLLTEDHDFEYTTVLARDLSASIFWK